MVSEIKLVNLTTKVEVRLGQENGYDYLFDDGDINWLNVPATHIAFSYPGQVGNTISVTDIRERMPTIEGYCYYILTPEDRALPRAEQAKLIERVIHARKRILNSLVNPLDFISVNVNSSGIEYDLTGKPNASILYGRTKRENNEIFCKFMITLNCNDPLFRQKTIDKSFTFETQPRFMFPLIIAKEKPIIFGYRDRHRTIMINNNGDIIIGAIITIEANKNIMQNIINPRIINRENGQQIVIRKTMQAGEKIIINTNDGNEKGIIGIIDDVESNYFKYWDFNNDWIKFAIGLTEVGFETDNHMEESLIITISIRPGRYALEVL